MRTASAATATALAVSLASGASTYSAVSVFDELTCGGSTVLREYTPDTANSCADKDCMAIPAPGVGLFSALPTCADNHLADTEKHFQGKSYVIIETYAGTGCTGDFTKAVAVAAGGRCIPSVKGDMSYVAVLNMIDLSVTWTQYVSSNCSAAATDVSVTASETDRKSCVQDTMRVLVVKRMADGTTAGPPKSKTPTSGSIATPAPTTKSVASGWTTVTLTASAVALTAATIVV